MSTESGIASNISPAPVQAVLLTTDPSPAALAMLRAKVAGVPLFTRHLLAFRQAGVHQVIVRVPSAILTEVRQIAHEYSPSNMDVRVRPDTQPDAFGPAAVEQSLHLLVDPRLVGQLVRLAGSQGVRFVCVDGPGGEDVDAKSPYRVGVPDDEEARPVDMEGGAFMPIGLAVRPASAGGSLQGVSVSTPLAVGRYYWHRVTSAADERTATWKVLLATMKPSDGIYARTNRRVSLRISRLLIATPVTPNQVTVATLALGIFAGWLLAQGRYAPVVAGSVVGWVASMLDGVDGELARAKFQASPFGHWLEMTCDYAFYIVLVLGLAEGFRRITGNPLWLAIGGLTAVGVVLGFFSMARLKRSFLRNGRVGDFNETYQQSVRTPTSHPLARITSYVTVFATRAAFPYYFVLFAVLGLMKFVLVVFFLATQAFWIGALVMARTTDRSRSSIQTSAESG